ncbi:MAG: hypothetical protein QOI84_1960 [Solirubrobacterales bacterium]|jgi:hypothetical protein|nr:hypothetical protein [Solirubrobacterales bacterium]
MEAMRQGWTDERLDDLAQRMDNGFARVDADLRALNARFDALQRTLLQVAAGLGAGLLTVIAALLGLIATQL